MKAYKAVWVDEAGKLWSLLQGDWSFYENDLLNQFAKPVQYEKGVDVSAPKEEKAKKYLFAFISPEDAMAYVQGVFKGHVKGSKFIPWKVLFKRGHVEIWEIEYTPFKMPFYDWATQPTKGMYEAILTKNMAHGTVYCETVKLVKKLTDLNKFK